MGKTRPSRVDPRWVKQTGFGAKADLDQPWSGGAEANLRFTGNNLKTDHLWPEITNPVIREVLTAAYRALPRDTFYGVVFDNPEYANIRIVDYQLWLGERLPHSGLAMGLAAGPDHLPDSTDELPQPWRYLARRYAPRNYTQLTRKIIFNLEWYVDQSRRPRDPWTIMSDIVPGTLWITGLLLATFLLTTSISRLPWLSICGVGLLLWAVVMLVTVLWGFDSHKHRTNCAELYHYLVREYSHVKHEDPEREYELKIDERYWLSPLDSAGPIDLDVARRRTGGFWPRR